MNTEQTLPKSCPLHPDPRVKAEFKGGLKKFKQNLESLLGLKPSMMAEGKT